MEVEREGEESSGLMSDVLGGRSPGLMSRGTLPCDLSHDALDVTYPPPVERQTPVKNYLLQTSYFGR